MSRRGLKAVFGAVVALVSAGEPRAIFAEVTAASVERVPASGRESEHVAVESGSSARKFGFEGFVPRRALRTPGTHIQSGQRVEVRGDVVRVSELAFGAGGDPFARQIPKHLGGGYLFLQPIVSGGMSVTALYRSREWTASAEPVASVPFVVNQVEFGFDRAYFLGTGLSVAFDLDERQILPLDPLPPLPTITGLRFAPDERALVSGPLAGVLLTEDAGITWMPIRGARSIVETSHDEGLFVRTREGLEEVLPGGATAVLGSSESTPRPAARGSAWAASTGDASAGADAVDRALAYVLAQGTVVGNRAVALRDAQLIVVSSEDGISVAHQPVSLKGKRVCQASAAEAEKKGGSASLLFVCARDGLREVYQLASDQLVNPGAHELRPRSLLRPSRRSLLLHDAGVALLTGDCRSSSPGKACLIAGNFRRSVVLPKLGKGLDALALDRGTLVRTTLDRKSSTLTVRRIGPEATSEKVYELAPESWEQEAARTGSLLLRGGIVDGEVAVWLTHRDKYVGLRLGDGQVASSGSVQRPLGRATFAAERAFAWGAAGFAKQSIDGGLTFSDVAVPFKSGDPQLASVTHPRTAVEVGCSAVGCVVGRYLRFGWSPRSEVKLPAPPIVRLLPKGGGKLNFVCGRGGYESPARRDGGGEGALPAFWELSAPAPQARADAFSIGFDSGVARLYGEGPAERSWGREGTLLLRFVDPWEPTRVRSTEATLRIFPSAARAREELGLLERHTMVTEVELDPMGDRGVALVRSRHALHMFVFREGQALRHFSATNPSRFRNMLGAVESAGAFHVGFLSGRDFSVYRLGDGGPTEMARFPLGNDSARETRLIRTTSGDLAVTMEGDDGLLIYPLTHDGELGSATLVPHRSTRPQACPPEAMGYIVDRPLNLTPYIEDPSGHALDVHALRARLLVGYGEPCLERLTGRSRDQLPLHSIAQTSQSIPLSLLNHDSSGKRAELLCN